MRSWVILALALAGLGRSAGEDLLNGSPIVVGNHGNAPFLQRVEGVE